MKEAICLDFETLATEENAVVLSVGAVKFDTEDGTFIDSNQITSKFELFLDVQEQLDSGRKVSWHTIEWWFKQSQEARDLQVSRNRVSVDFFLRNFIGWMGEPKDRTCTRVWVRGQDFDGSIMNTLARKAKVQLPWAYNAYRDMRYLEDICKDHGIKREGVYHSALDDAIYQARVISHINQRIKV